jgi:hypothetical protein
MKAARLGTAFGLRSLHVYPLFQCSDTFHYLFARYAILPKHVLLCWKLFKKSGRPFFDDHDQRVDPQSSLLALVIS